VGYFLYARSKSGSAVAPSPEVAPEPPAEDTPAPPPAE
jgi:hypothetical protein